MHCQVCGSDMIEVKTETILWTRIEQFCTTPWIHGDCTRIPTEWRGPNAVAIMRKLAAIRVGGIIEDETGWWQITQVDRDGTVWLLGRDGEERGRWVGNLGTITYDHEDTPCKA